MSDDKKNKDDAKKKIVSSLSGAIDPEIRVAGEQFGAWLASVIPTDNWLRSKAAERVFGILREWAESNIEKLGPIGSATGEKFTDFLDHASGEIFGRGTEKHLTTKPTKPSSTLEKAVDGWTNDFFKSAGERLKKAKPDELDELKKRLTKEFKIRRALLKMMEKEFEKPEAKEEVKGEPPIDWAVKLHKEWGTTNSKWEDWLKERSAQLESNRTVAKDVREARETGSRVVWTRGPEIAVILPPKKRGSSIVTALNWPWRFFFKLFFSSPEESFPVKTSEGAKSVPTTQQH